ncbi:carbamoyltransferase HypF [Halovenus sp. WSH3]|uniref:Carbamoyltransferase n=1 Tax=Halovenus carboxidivorans TaxID=2692199 RepID=A0A6B0TBB7_9EURY|nr:carbamoyltransferase HypF [Halovenus carboxidivorans]MXR52662.1 carbamoyltransferase HypF [Halovenus carboxidivorans]
MPTNTERFALSLTVRGTVQGVGFRPFVARTAAEAGVTGSVANTDAGVEIHFEGDRQAVERAAQRVRSDPPRLATLADIEVSEAEPQGTDEFEIVPSEEGPNRTTLVPPDTALCAACREEIRSETSRFHDYWATACVDCGPRFAVTRALPYDRATTAMAEFEPCSACRDDYEDRTDRRFHAQTIACPDCGPTLSAVDTDGTTRATGTDALDWIGTRLDEGAVVGLMGTGGCHIACDGTDPDLVERLRTRLGRPAKPLATMARSLDSVREFATVTPGAADLLRSKRRPIVLLGHGRTDWLDAVAPGLDTVGVMLPYSGIHHLLFERLDSGPLVMTSANRPGEPMATDRSSLLALSDALDAALVHDREIVNRCDDSVVRPVNGDRRLLRRSRGHVPRPLDRPVQADAEVLAVGAGTDVTVALTRGDIVLPSQHIGEPETPTAADAHREASNRLCELLSVSPDVVAHDCHPELETTAIATDRAERTVAVQHHHAHAASLLAEHDRDRAIVIAADGTGYSPDGVVRGGEVLDSGLADSERVGGLSRFRLPGGEAAVREPARVAAALLSDTDRERAVSLLRNSEAASSRADAETILEQPVAGVNSPYSTSAGRFLDAVAALLGVCSVRRYRGEPAMRLEAAAGDPVALDPPLTRRDGQLRLDATAAMDRLASLDTHRDSSVVAATAQRLLGLGLAEIAVTAADERSLDAVGFTGGVAYNEAIDRVVRQRVETAGYTYLGHHRVPPGDAGLAYGQAVAASARLADS